MGRMLDGGGSGGGAPPGAGTRLGGGGSGADMPRRVFWRGAEFGGGGGATGARADGAGATLGRDFFASPSNTSKSDPPLSFIAFRLS